MSSSRENADRLEKPDGGDKQSKSVNSQALQLFPVFSRLEWTTRLLKLLKRILPARIRPNSLLSFKNRILVSTLLLMAAMVFFTAVALQITVFPELKDNIEIIRNIKTIHLIAGIIVFTISWLFVEIVAKRITSPLRELTNRADQISRSVVSELSDASHNGEVQNPEGIDSAGDEILQLTISFNRMLTHLRAADLRLRESESKYRFLFDHGPAPIFVMDAQTFEIMDVNARAQEEYQYSSQELLQMKFTDLGLENNREQIQRAMLDIQNDVTLMHLLKHRRKDKSIFMVNYQASLSRYMNRPAIIAAVWDVTERLEKYAKVVQAGKMATLGEMATGIAHELNQPLHIVKLACDYMNKRIKMEKPVTLEEMKQIIHECNTSVDRASKIINHLRQFGRKTETTLSLVNIHENIKNVFNLLGRQLEVRGIKYELDLTEREPLLLGDGNRLEQVFINLILNSCDAVLGDSHGKRLEYKITISTKIMENRIIVEFRDNGPGIPEDIGNKVFEPFFTTKAVGEGTGLGLSISYGIVQEHKGTIELLKSSSSGAAFELTFPCATGANND